MATVCGGSLALMDAGVQIKSPVAGIAMGLIKEGEKVVVLTDILGDEDHYGDMDFKVAGTKTGITGFQMDIKISGVTREVLRQALAQAREGREFILGKMEEALPGPRQELSPYAPRFLSLRIKPDRIREIIGPQGKIIRGIQDETGVKINVEDDGLVQIFSPDRVRRQGGGMIRNGSKRQWWENSISAGSRNRTEKSSAPLWRFSPGWTAWSISRSLPMNG